MELAFIKNYSKRLAHCNSVRLSLLSFRLFLACAVFMLQETPCLCRILRNVPPFPPISFTEILKLPTNVISYLFEVYEIHD